jgi:hypothetical protein
MRLSIPLGENTRPVQREASYALALAWSGPKRGQGTLMAGLGMSVIMYPVPFSFLDAAVG